MTYRIEQKNPCALQAYASTDRKHGENMEVILLSGNKPWKAQSSGNLFLSDQKPGTILGVSIYQDPLHIFYYIAAQTEGPVPEDVCIHHTGCHMGILRAIWKPKTAGTGNIPPVCDRMAALLRIYLCISAGCSLSHMKSSRENGHFRYESQ